MWCCEEISILPYMFPGLWAEVLVIDDARGRVNEKCVACLVAYRTTALAYK